MAIHMKPRMRTEKLDTEIRKEQIAQATLEVIAADGLAKVSVAAVARRVGVVPSALYRHFKGKEQVLDAAMEMILGRLLENVEAVLAEQVAPLDHLKRLLDRHIRMVRENRGIPQMLLSQDFYAQRPDRRERVHEGIRAYLARVADLIREAQKVGQADPDIDADTVSVIFLGLIQPPAILWHMSNNTFDVDGQGARAWPLFLRAIRPGKAGQL
jgi:AcrR family transcriptional regulator